jgi:hypothetical protein
MNVGMWDMAALLLTPCLGCDIPMGDRIYLRFREAGVVKASEGTRGTEHLTARAEPVKVEVMNLACMAR